RDSQFERRQMRTREMIREIRRRQTDSALDCFHGMAGFWPGEGRWSRQERCCGCVAPLSALQFLQSFLKRLESPRITVDMRRRRTKWLALALRERRPLARGRGGLLARSSTSGQALGRQRNRRRVVGLQLCSCKNGLDIETMLTSDLRPMLPDFLDDGIAANHEADLATIQPVAK